jgi:repressor LexA
LIPPFSFLLLVFCYFLKLDLIIAHVSWAVNTFLTKKQKKFSFRGFYVIIYLQKNKKDSIMNKEEIAIIIGENIKQYRLQNGWTQQELGAKIGISKNAIGNYEKGFRSPKKDTMFDLANAFNISIDDLFPPVQKDSSSSTSPIQTIYDELKPLRQAKVLNYAERQLKEQRNEEDTKKTEVSEDIIQLYSYDYYDHPASAGTGQYLNDVRVEQIELPVDIDADFVIPIKGDSMEPDYHDGDLVFIQTSVDLTDGVIGVFNYNGDAYIKQLVIDKDQAYLHSLNPVYKDMPITPETDFRIIGEVVDLYREK